jgi:peptide/nickel transport system permease protein
MRYVLKRLLISVIMLLGVSILIFAILRALPGDPVLARLAGSQGVDQNTIARLRTEAGLDRPLSSQYWSWMAGAVHGNLGRSYFSHLPVSTLLAQRIGPTAELTFVAIALSILIALPMATIAAQHPGSWVDRILTAGTATGMSFPPFVAGILLILLFSVSLHWLPARGYVSLADDPIGNLRTILLPSLALATGAAPLIFRYLKGELVSQLRSRYAQTAEGKGASPTQVVLRHALRNAALPSLTMIGLLIGYTLGGSVIVEYVFGISGLGSLSVESAFDRDYAVLQSVVLLVSAMFVVVTLLVDLATTFLDPRTKGVIRG